MGMRIRLRIKGNTGVVERTDWGVFFTTSCSHSLPKVFCGELVSFLKRWKNSFVVQIIITITTIIIIIIIIIISICTTITPNFCYWWWWRNIMIIIADFIFRIYCIIRVFMYIICIYICIGVYIRICIHIRFYGRGGRSGFQIIYSFSHRGWRKRNFTLADNTENGKKMWT